MKVKEVLTVLPVALLLGLGVVTTLAPQQAYAKSSSVPDMIPSTGTDFWLTYMYNFAAAADDDALQLEIVAIPSASGTISITCGDGTKLVENAPLTAGSAYEYVVPDDKRAKVYNTTSAEVKSTGLHVESSVSITLYLRNYYSTGGMSDDASPVIGTSSLGTEYVVQTFSRDMENTEFAIVATENGTEVDVTFSNAMALKPNKTSTFDAGHTETVTLNKGQTYQILGKRKTANSYLSGTTVKSNKPIALFNGGVKAYVPAVGVPNGDHVVEQALPISAWGKRFVATPMHGIPSGEWAMVQEYQTHVIVSAIYDDTKVYVNGSLLTTLSPGQTTAYSGTKVITLKYGDNPKLIETSNPAIVYSYMPTALTIADDSETEYTYSEPSSALLVDANRGVKEASIFCWGDPLDLHYADVIVHADSVSGMRLTNANGTNVDISGQFKTLGSTFAGYSHYYAHARIVLANGLNVLSNASGAFVATHHSTAESATSEANATVFNLAPIAPELYVDDYRVSHGEVADFCNQHPGVKFKAKIDYPHDSIKWDLGEGAITTVVANSDSYNNSHMYGKTISQGDTTHNIRLYVFHHSPLAGIKDTDSICVSLVVHPVYYDTLKTKVAAKHLEYIWNKSSNPAFGIEGKGEITLDPAVTMGKDATNPNNKWTTANDSKQIFDSLVYHTKEYGCDSIFYLELDVVPDILMPEETASVCQGEAFTWDGHHNAWNHLTQNGTPITEINTATAGTFEIRDTMQSLVFPYPDSIHVLTLTVLDKPTLTGFPTTKIERCAEDESPFTISYGSQYATQIEYWMRSGTDPDIRHVTEAVGSSFSITTPEDIEPGDYVLYAKTLSATCQSVTYQVDVTIHKRPTLKSLSMKEGNTAKCYPADEFIVEYDHTNSPAEIWYKVTEGENPIKDWTKETVVSGKTFTINTATPSNWADGKTYTVEAYVKTNAENGSCESEHKTTTFQILKQPTITNVSITNQCDDETKTVLKFTTADATKYRYKFDSGDWSDYVTGIADGDHIVSDLDISSLSHGTHTITMQAASEACLSEETTPFEFTIYEMPSAAITSAAPNKCITAVTGNETITYTNSAVTTQIKWQLDRPGTRSTIGWNTLEVGKSLTITPAQLDTAGHYILTITAHSANCDSTELKKGTLEFDLYDTAHINLDDIEGFCKGEALNATYTTTEHPTTKYTYQIDTESGTKVIGPTDVTTIDNKIPSDGTSGLAAGKYVLRVWASNDHDCAASEVRKKFEIHPIPEITKLGKVANLCETEVESRTITVSGTSIKDVKYELKRDGTKVEEKTVTLSSGRFILATGSLDAGNYTLRAKPISDKGCEGDWFATAVEFTVYPKPEIDLTTDYTFCEGSQAKLDVAYTQQNISKFDWALKLKSGGDMIKNGSVSAPFSGTFTIPGVNTLEAGKYIVYASAINDHGDATCHSENDTINIKVNKTPTATITNVEKEKCASEKSVTVTYNTSPDATTYEYRVFKSGVLVDAATKTEQTIGTTFKILLSELDGAGSYEVRLVAKSDDCASDTAKGAFEIYALPEITLLKDTSACEGAGVAKVRYAANDAAVGGMYSYTVQGTEISGTGTLSAAKGLIEVSTTGLAGDYTVSVTVVSTNNCNSADAKTATIHLYPQPSMTIEPIDDICEKTPSVSTTITSLVGATKYKYVVLKDGASFLSVDDPQTDMTITLNTSDWTEATYTLQVTAVSDEGCGSTAAETEFKVNPQPKVDELTALQEVCEKTTTTVSYDFQMTGATSYTFRVNDGTQISGNGTVPASGKGTITFDPKDLTADYEYTEYTLYVTAKSNKDCESAPKTATLRVNNMPSMTVKEPQPQCHPAAKFVVEYTPVHAARILWKVDGKYADYQLHNVPNPGFGEYKIEIDTHDWDPGTYTFRAFPQSSINCDSAEVTFDLVINPTPTIVGNKFTIDNLCAQATATVKFQHTDGETVKYRIDGGAEKTAAISGSASDASFLADINGLVGEHTIRMQVISDKGCESAVTADQTFIIYPIPTLALNDTSAIWREDLNSIDVRYSGTELTGGTYTYTISDNNNVTVISETNDQTFPATNLIHVNTKDLAPGTYSLSVTAKSANGCEASATAEIEIFYPTDVEIDVPIVPVDSCEGTTEPIKVYIHTKYADKYSYEVVLKGTTEHPVDNYSGSETYTNTEDTPVDKTIELDIRNWAAGTYTVTVTAENTTIGAKKSETVDFIIYPKPVLTFTQPEAVCAGATTTVTIQHSTENVNTVAFRVEKDGADFPSATWTTSTGSITLNTSDWTGGTYKIYGTPTSKYGCEGEESAVPAVLVVNDQPTASITAIDENVCEGTAYLNVGFDASADAHAYAFSILNAGDQSVKTGGADFSGGSLSVAVDIKGLEPGNYKFELKTKTEKGCWSKPDTKSFCVRDTFLNVTKAKICESETYTWKYGDHSEEIKGSDHFHNPVKADTIDRNFPTATYGCDSIYRLILTVEKEYVFVTDTTICYGEKFNWIVKDKCSGEPVELMRGLTATTYQVDTLPCGDLWCPPVYILDLKVREEYAAEAEYYTLSEDETLTWRGQSITEAGTYEDRVSKPADDPKTHGCDSVYRIIVDKAKVERKVSNQDVCYGETVYFNHKKFTNLPVGQSVLFDTLRTTTGYDSVYLRLNLTVGQRYYDSVSVSACDHYVWPVNGNTYMHSGIYREELATVDGCDSIFVLNLTVNKQYEFYETYDIDSTQLPFTIHDYTYTGGGEFDRAFTAKGGCDSIYHLQIIVHEELYESDTVTRVACTNELPYLWRGGKYYHTGIYSVTTKDPDSTHVMYLTVNDAYSDTTYVHACSSYKWPVNGKTYNTSTIVAVPDYTTLGCDSTVVLKLTVGGPTDADVNVNACQYEMTTIGNRTFVPNDTKPNKYDFTRTLRNSSGCDSMVTYKVTVIPRFYKTDTTFADICEGATYTWDNSANEGGIHTYTKAGTYYDSVPDANGCTKDVYTLKLSAKPTYWIDEDVEVHESALPYAWVGHKGDTLLSTNGDYYDYLTSVISGCDSIHHIHFHVNWVERHYDAPLEGCESVKWRNKTYTESGLVSDTVFTDSKHTKYKDVYFCEITVNHKVEQAEPDFTICQNEAFTWHGQSYEASHFEPGDHPLTAESANECDTIYKTTLHVKQTYYVNETMNDVCATDLPIEWHGQLLTKDDISGGKIKATDSRPAPNGCDTIYSLTMTVHSVTAPQASPAAAICLGKTYEWKKDGKLLMTIPGKVAGTHTYYYWYTVPGECDSTYLRLDLTVNDPETPTPVNVFICHGEKYDWVVPGCNPGDPEVVLMKGLTESTQQTYTLPCEGDGCSPIYELNLTVYPEYAHVDDPAHLCAGETLKWRGLTITKGGEYEARVEDAVDVRGDGSFYCDSIYRITVTKLEPEEKSSSMTVCYGTPVVFNNHEYTGLEVGNHTLKETISSVVDGCDSLYLTLNLTVEPYSYDSIVVTECDSYTWKKKDGGDGKTYTESGIYRVEEKTSSGCGSVSVLNLTIKGQSYSFNEAYDVPSTEMPFTVHGCTYTEAGKYDCAFTTGSGCDSIYHITLTVHKVPLPEDTIYAAICEGETYTWGGKEYSESGRYTYEEKDVAIHVVYLTVNKKYSHTTPVKLCGETSYKWDVDGNTYTKSGTYKWPGKSIAGCDSIETLVLTLGQPNTGEETVTVCQNEPVTIGNRSFVATENTSFTQTLTNGSGCDSVVTYTVNVTPRTYTAVEKPDDYCEGTTYTWRGHTYETAGTYFDTTFNGGCATEIHTLELESQPYYRYDKDAHFDEDVEVWEKALPYTWVGHMNDTLLRTNGDYYDRQKTINGCDSIYHIHFHVNFVKRDTVEDSGCDSYTWDVNGKTYTESDLVSDTVFIDAEHTDYSEIHFCDVTIYPSYDVDSTLIKHICSDQQPFEWFGQTRSVPQDAAHQVNDHMFVETFQYTKQTTAGCDSLEANLTLYLHLPYETTITEDMSVCDSYNWDGLIITKSGKYERRYDNYGLGGCADSVLYRNFTVYSSETEEETVEACEYYVWRGEKYTESGDYEDDEAQGGICTKKHILHLTIKEPAKVDIDVKACDTYTWPEADGGTGETYTTSGTYTRTFAGQAANGCDSIRYLNLTIGTTQTVTLPGVTACDSYEWKFTEGGDGQTYTTSTVAEKRTPSLVTGCDSITRLPITINHSVVTDVPAITACYEYHDVQNDIHITTEGYQAITRQYKTAAGCDSTVNFYITVNMPTLIEHTVTACQSYEWKGETYGPGYYDIVTKYTPDEGYGCDSVVTMHLTVNPTMTTNSTVIVKGTSYYWAEADETLTTAGIHEHTFSSIVTGCDSIVRLNLILNDPDSPEETQIICRPDAPYVWQPFAEAPYVKDAQVFSESGDYTEQMHIDDGIREPFDSIRTLHLTIQEQPHTSKTDTACGSYAWDKDGQVHTASGMYLHDGNDGICDYTDTLYLTIHPIPEATEVNVTACDLFTVNGETFRQTGRYERHWSTAFGCDSTVFYNIKINERQMTTVNVDACDSYTWEYAEGESETFTKSGSYTQVLTGANGCDSVVTLVLSIHRPYNVGFDACGHYVDNYGKAEYVWDNRTYNAAGNYEWSYQSVHGCDSIVTMHLSMPVTGTSENVIACDEYLWHGRLLNTTGFYTDTITSLLTGCDSVASLILTMDDHKTGSETVVEPTSSYSWWGETYYESGDYEHRFTMDDGSCDSIATLHLTIEEPLPISNEISATACDAYTWDRETFYTSGVYVRNFTTIDGRDSIVKLTLTINHDTTVYVTDKLCGPYIWHLPNGDRTIDESGEYTEVLQRASGCDSVVTLTLTLCESFNTTFAVEARDVYVWDGRTYTESGDYSRLYSSTQGCDSTVTMQLTIIKTQNAEDEAEACTRYAWADSIFTESTIHSHVFPASTGGDSIVTMTIIIHQPVFTDLYDTVKVCDPADPTYSGTYTLPWNEQVSHTGIYCDTLESALSGCDSIVRFHLQWCDEPLCIDTLPIAYESVCGSYTWDKTGLTYSTTGTYDYHERADDGCEHVSLLRLEILPQAYLTIDTTACESLYWEATDETFTESGTYRYVQTGAAANGCDSTTILRVVIGHAGEGEKEINSCEAYTINGQTYTESGTYVQDWLTTTTGCDSTLTIHLTLSPTKDTTVSGTACDDTVWNNVTYTETGFWPQVLQTAAGCDSLVTLNLIVYGSKDINYIDTTHCDSIVWGPDREGKDTIIYDDGIYTRVFESAIGCDSTVTMDLRLKRHDFVIARDTQACDSFVWNDKVYFETKTYYDTLVSTRTGCDSITQMHITIDPTIRVEIEDTVPPPFYLWPTENDTIWESGDYLDTVPSFITGCDSITTLHLVMTDSIILDPQEPVRIDTFGYCPGDTVDLIYNLLKGHPTKYILIFDTVAPRVPDYTRDFMSVLDTTDLENHGMDSLFTVVVPENCEPGVYCAHLQLFDDFSSSEVYDFCIRVNYKDAIVSMWTDVVAINNYEGKFIGYQWYKDDELIPGATKQYYSDGEDLNACYRARVQLADSSWIFTCEACFDLRTDSLELIAYPTPAPVGQPVTIKAMGILLEKLAGSRITITKEQGLTVKEFTLAEGERSVDVELSAGLYIATLITGDADDRGPRTANVKFIVF